MVNMHMNLILYQGELITEFSSLEESEAEVTVSLHHETVSSTTGVSISLILFFVRVESKINYH